MKSKYVIIERNGAAAVIVFSSFLLHEDIARNHKIKSAGYCELDGEGRWIVSGASLSLQSGPGPRDDEILNLHLLNKRPASFANQPIRQQAM